jgi:hypothetical protein
LARLLILEKEAKSRPKGMSEHGEEGVMEIILQHKQASVGRASQGVPGAVSGDGGQPMAARVSIRDVSLFVEVVGHGYPLVLMHGGPGADHWTMLPFRRLADRFTLIFYDHRGNGRWA